MARWEWRTFFSATLPEHLRERFGLEDEVPEESDEIYIVAPGSPNNVKIRHGRIDIKILEATDRGLERWRPTFDAAFPIPPRAIHAAFEAWRLPSPVVVPTSATLDVFLNEVVRPVSALHIVSLQKRRRRTVIQGCRAEHALIIVDGGRWQTIAIEDEDPNRVLAAVATLELGPRPNTSYPVALKAIIAGRPHPQVPGADAAEPRIVA